MPDKSKKQMSRKACFSISLIVFLFAGIILSTGSSLLLVPIKTAPYIPLGTFLTWAGIIALPLSIFFGIPGLYRPRARGQRIFRAVLVVIIVLACLWGGVGYSLAGNWAMNFRDQSEFRGSSGASELYWYYNYFIVLAPLVFLLIYGIYHLALRIHKKWAGKQDGKG